MFGYLETNHISVRSTLGDTRRPGDITQNFTLDLTLDISLNLPLDIMLTL